MRHLPIFLDTQDTSIVVSGGGEAAVAKIRLLLKTAAHIRAFAVAPSSILKAWAEEGKIALFERKLQPSDILDSRLVYAANDEPHEDARVALLGRHAGVLVNVVDNLEESDFITPALVDRAPVTVAIGSEGAAPVLARQIKAQLEDQLDSQLGLLARVGQEFRGAAAGLPRGRITRAFWSEYYEAVGPAALADGGEASVRAALAQLLAQHLSAGSKPNAADRVGYVWLIGAGPGDPDLLTTKARRAMHNADVIVHDRLVSKEVLELARREALFVEVGKSPGGASWRQEDINKLMVEHAGKGQRVARLKSGDPTIFGRLDEEMDALDDAQIKFELIPGTTTAIAAASRLKVSLTKRHRNSEFRFLTGQNIQGFAEHDWRTLSQPGSIAAIYMGLRATRFLQGRLLMHGALPSTPISVIENVSRPNEKVVATTLANLDDAVSASEIRGPAIILFGLSPREVSKLDLSELPTATEATAAIGAN